MVKKKKNINKDEKYFKLAKQQGYRSRAAFKLTQLNKEYQFLEKSRVLIDLCAAPGGWCQVASKYMPVGSTIIGLDLLPIRKIPGVLTFEAKNGGDITTPLCRTVLKKNIGGSNADVVLCDGAPNVGANWSRDAYGQSELALKACQLATEFLKRGGCFVTKVFRSSDYTALLWVFQQLFQRVDSMKPSSSRAQSAEIFVVCRGYLAPDRIDPRLLDPKYAFKQVAEPQKVVDVLHKKDKHKKHREGYDESLGQVLSRECSVAKFVEADSQKALEMLGMYNSMEFDDRSKRFLEHKSTTDEIKECFTDLKVLGKADFKRLIKWRYVMNHMLDKERPKPVKQASEIDDSAKKLTPEEEALERMRRKSKRETKKAREAKSKFQRRIDLGIEPGTAVDRVIDDEIFSLRDVKNPELVRSANTGDSTSEEDEWNADAEYATGEDYTERLEQDLDLFYNNYRETQEKRSAMPVMLTSKGQTLTKRKRATMEEKIRLAREAEEYEKTEERQKERAADYFKLLSKDMSDSDDSSGGESVDEETAFGESDDSDDENKGKPASKKPVPGSEKKGDDKLAAEARAARWFSNPAFGRNGLGEDDDESDSNDQGDTDEGNSADEETDVQTAQGPTDKLRMEVGEMPKTDKQIRHERRKRLMERNERRENKRRKKSELEIEIVSQAAPSEEDAALAKRTKETEQLIKAGMGATIGKNSAENNNTFETVPQDVDSIMRRSNFDTDPEDGHSNDGDASSDDDTRAHTLAMGQFMLTHSGEKRLIESAYNRYAWNDPDDLPSWFVEDEKMYNQPQLPVTKQMVLEAKARLKALNEAPIKKVAEARARKKLKASRMLEKAKKLAERIVDDDQLTAKTKMKAIAKAMSKTKTPRPGSVHVVVRKGGKSTVSKGSKAGKPKVKFVDRRMRNDERALKRHEKKTGGRSGKKSGGGGKKKGGKKSQKGNRRR
jgi:AdoMet-dependent rRNA methyltransferase SPB1